MGKCNTVRFYSRISVVYYSIKHWVWNLQKWIFKRRSWRNRLWIFWKL